MGKKGHPVVTEISNFGLGELILVSSRGVKIAAEVGQIAKEGFCAFSISLVPKKLPKKNPHLNFKFLAIFGPFFHSGIKTV